MQPLSRLLVLQGAIAVALSLVVGVAATIQVSSGLSKFGGLEYAPRVILVSAVRAYGGSVSTLSALLALLAWTHRVSADAVRQHLRRAAPWALSFAALATPVTTGLAVASGLLISHWVYGVSSETIGAARSTLVLREDVPAAAFGFAVNALFYGAFCWLVFPAMRRRSWSLLRKIAMTGAAVALVRVVFTIATV
jgi:hypothetical protein